MIFAILAQYSEIARHHKFNISQLLDLRNGWVNS